MRRLFLGIDPGLKGGYALTDPAGDVYEAAPLPILKTSGKSSLNILAFSCMLKFFKNEEEDTTIECVIEKVHSMPRQGVVSTFTFGKNFGSLLGVLISLEIPTLEVTPQVWKKLLFGYTSSDKLKSIDFALSLIDRSDDFIHIRRGGKPHDGVAEAICIAEYARREKHLFKTGGLHGS